MRKLLLALFVVFGMVQFTTAQQYQTAIGLKGGFPGYGSVSLKHFFGGSSALEANLGGGYRHLWLQALYEKNFNIQGGLDWYIGGGADLGFWTNGYRYRHPHWDDDRYYTGVFGGIDGIIGLEYTFEQVPINIALDATPTIRLFPWVGFYIYGSLAVRFAIK